MYDTGKIVRTELGKEDHGIMTLMLHIEGDGWGCGFGGVALDRYDKSKKERVATAFGMECITRLMDTFSVNRWEDMKGQYVRLIWDGSRIKKIGNIIKEKWFAFEYVPGYGE